MATFEQQDTGGRYGDGGRGAEGRDESYPERLDRNLEELNGELRVVVTGVQVLFAFLLVVPFDSGFLKTGRFERDTYLVTLLLAAISAACTIAPTAAHRLLFQAGDKATVVRYSNMISIAGLAFLALAMSGAMLLVSSRLFGTTTAAIVAAAAASVFALLWFALPLARRRQRAAGG